MANDAASRVVITRVPLGAFVLLAACLGFSLGIVVGIMCLAASPFGVFDFELPERSGGFSLRGVRAGLLLFCGVPLYYTFVFTVIAFPAYLPFRFLSRVLRPYEMPADCVMPVATRDDGTAEATKSVQAHDEPDAADGAG